MHLASLPTFYAPVEYKSTSEVEFRKKHVLHSSTTGRTAGLKTWGDGRVSRLFLSIEPR